VANGVAVSSARSSAADCGRSSGAMARQRRMICSSSALTARPARWLGGMGWREICCSWISVSEPPSKTYLPPVSR
jgi:hypothetical protein